MFLFLISHYNKEPKNMVGFDLDSIAIQRSFSKHEYNKSLKLIDKAGSKIPNQNRLWLLCDIYWDLYRIYDIGYISALRLQEYNYCFYYKNLKIVNPDLAIPSLYFLANDFYFDGQSTNANSVLDSLTLRISTDHPLFLRTKILRSRGDSFNVKPDHPDYLYSVIISNKSYDKFKLRERLQNVKNFSNGLSFMRELDLLELGLQGGFSDDVKRIILNDTTIHYGFEALIQDSLKFNFIDSRYLYIKRNLFLTLFKSIVDELLQDTTESFDPYSFERAGWAYLLSHDYLKSAEYFQKWLEKLPDFYGGNELEYQSSKYLTLCKLSKNLYKGQYSTDFQKDDWNNLINLNTRIVYNLFYYQLSKSYKSTAFFKNLARNKKYLLQDLDTNDLVRKQIFLENLALAIKYYELTQQVEIAEELILWVNTFSKGYALDQLDHIFNGNPHTLEFYVMFPYGLADKKEHLFMVSQAYLANQTFPISTEVTELIQLKGVIDQQNSDGKITLGNN